MVHERFEKALEIAGIEATIVERDFRYYRDIPAVHSGVYVLTEGDKVIYVGKGNIYDRQRKHWQKAYGTANVKQDTKGWQWLRENVEIKPDQWKIYYVNLWKQTELSLVEGYLIHWLNPLANNETCIDEGRIQKG